MYNARVGFVYLWAPHPPDALVWKGLPVPTWPTPEFPLPSTGTELVLSKYLLSKLVACLVKCQKSWLPTGQEW